MRKRKTKLTKQVSDHLENILTNTCDSEEEV